MRCGYFDCFSGAAGDMILGALVDAGLQVDILRHAIGRLRLPGVELELGTVRRGGLMAMQVSVRVDPQAACRPRHLPEILAIIAGADLPPRVSQSAQRIFGRLAEAEGRVHGIPPEQVHFHEVGAADAMVDIVGACVGIEALGIEKIVCSPIPTGCGMVRCQHGVLPVPAPATAELLRGVPLAACDEPAELTTPTGAAILTTLADSYGALPPMRIDAIGYGAGTRDNPARPNVLRLFIGQLADRRTSPQPLADSDAEEDQVVVLETEVDDATGQAVAFAVARTLEAGALDAYAVPIVMKKGRPGQLLTVLCRPDDVASVEAILFAETTTFGIRRHECLRRKLSRQHVVVQTAFGPIRVKVGRRGGEVLQAWPEFEDCEAAARASGAALRQVQDAALHQWARQQATQASSEDGVASDRADRGDR